MASDPGKLLAQAFERAWARFRVLDPVAQLSFDVPLEARAEVRAELARRIERERCRIRRAAGRIAEAKALDAAIAAIAADPASAAEHQQGYDGHGPPAAAVPCWHPEHPRNDTQET